MKEKADARTEARPVPAKTAAAPDRAAVPSKQPVGFAVSPERRLAKIFTAMQPKDAARVLEQMSDGDVRAIIAMLGDRQAAAVLANFPPQRAAVISRLTMREGTK
jgi:flagellar motility protein MotE (MotC chaperone)